MKKQSKKTKSNKVTQNATLASTGFKTVKYDDAPGITCFVLDSSFFSSKNTKNI